QCWFLALLAAFAAAGSAMADVKMPAIFGSKMALQRDAPIPVWGTAEPNEKVTVTIGDQNASAQAGADGKWKATLKPLSAGGPLTMTVAGKNTLKFENVLVGEVWVCSGQSNMGFTLGGVKDADKEIPAANFPKIRLFSVKRVTSATPAEDVEGQWEECTSDTAKKFTAVGYLFGRDVHQALNVPVGLFDSSWGGTPAEAWTRKGVIENDPELKTMIADWETKIANRDQDKKKFDQQMEKWTKDVEKAKAEKKELPRKPNAWVEPEKSPNRPANLYNGMIAPLVPYAIRGAIWYQGESNASRYDQYAKLFPTMIRDWRAQWGEGDFPFLFVQLANFKDRKDEPSDSDWARLREAQSKTLALPKTGQAVIIDIGEAKNIHPKNKQDVGKRLQLAAMKVAYGKNDVVFSGPTFDKLKVEGGKAILSFKNVGGGLVNKADGAIKGFAIVGADKKFVWADAKIAGDTVVVSSDQVKEPVAVRYGWADNPEVSLYNKEGIPASPFRTDDWPMPPAPAKPQAK
ncbi:MAG: sialate O-acetylesterase, partial [Candidatus Sumerlaeota bacterium]|nr:sialate O-acetylesterase [Candidatus Sumerlaeota bacterium]